MADQEFKIKVVSDADLSGFNSAQNATQQLAEGGAKLADGTHDLAKETEDAAESEKLFAGEGREMHKVIGEITRISPALGEALRIAMNPIGGTIAAAIGLFVLMKEHISDVEKELDEMADKAAEPDFLEGIRAKADALREAGDKAQEYAAQLDSVVEGEHSVTAELTAQLTLLAAISAARGAQSKADQSLATAKISADEARGVITPEQAIQKRAEIERKAIADEAKSRQADQDQQLAAKQAALDKANAALPGGHDAAKKLQSDLAVENARRIQTANDFGDAAYDKKLADLNDSKRQEKIAASDAYLAQLQREHAEGGGDAAWLAEVKGANDALHLPDKQLRQGRAQYEANVNSEPQFNAQKIAAEEAKKIAESQDKLAVEIKALKDTIAATRDSDNAATRSRIKAVSEGEVSEVAKTDFGKDVSAEKGDAFKILAGHGDAVSQSSQALIQNLGDMMAGHAVTLAQAAQAVSKANSNQQSYLAAFQSFNATAEAMKNYSEDTNKALAKVMGFLRAQADQIRALARNQ